MGAQCGPCAMMVPKVRQWQESLQDRLTIAIVTTGTPEMNEHLLESGLEDVLFQEEFEVLEAFAVTRTPTALVIARDGYIASNLGETEQAIEPLVRLALLRGNNVVSVEGSAA